MRTSLNKDEKGIASIVIAILIIIILSSIVFGFVQVIGREQRQSLDKQLSSQAFYAAESAINDAVKAINDQNFTGDKTDCNPYTSGGPASLSGNSNMLTADGNVKYTCLLIDQKPSTLEYKSIRTDHAVSFPVAAADNSAVNSVSFSFRDVEKDYDSFRAAGDRSFSTAGAWGSTGILRADIVSFSASPIQKSEIDTNTRSYFFYPNRSSANGTTFNVQPFSNATGEIIDGSCGGSGSDAMCNVTINGLPGTRSYVRLISIYKPVSVKIKAGNTAIGDIRDLKDAQIDVDATGKAADVVRRVSVRIPRQSTDIPDFAVASMDSLCKKFLVRPERVFNNDSTPECDINR